MEIPTTNQAPAPPSLKTPRLVMHPCIIFMMDNTNRHLTITLFLFFTVAAAVSADDSPLKTYIVHVRNPEGTDPPLPQNRETWYTSLLSSVLADETPVNDRIIHFYGEVVNGFAAKLTQQELDAMSEKNWFVHAYPDRFCKLHTTHTPDFLGLHPSSGVWKQSNLGEGIIIGMIDTGVTPDHLSFNDDGMPPPPTRWKGRCDFNTSFCNNKLIGARSYYSGPSTWPPLDETGHGTNTASIAAGAFVKNASDHGLGGGTAAGMAPRAHLAIYSLRDLFFPASDVVAAMNAAVEDGVDVLSISLGEDHGSTFDDDPIGNAAFRAMEKGVFVSCGAGNNGPEPGTIINEAPWLLTVGASTTDRKIRATVELGNGVEINGESRTSKDSVGGMLPLVYAGDCLNFNSSSSIDVRGKIVLCLRQNDTTIYPDGTFDPIAMVKSAGGVALIIMNDDYMGSTTGDLIRYDAPIAITNVGYFDGIKIKAYINSSTNPTGKIVFKGTVTGVNPATVVASFSSRGPSLMSPGILKPDIIAPGVNILAGDRRAYDVDFGPDSPFTFYAGTSLACPHLSGIAALLKSLHPDWSPAAIKSAVMTTADVVDRSGLPIMDAWDRPADLFTIGAGHVNVTSIADPGLVYDINADDYIAYMCGMGYKDYQLQSITNNHTLSCSSVKSITEAELNYPSISFSFGTNTTEVSVSRTVTNVGDATSVYRAKVDVPAGISARVRPQRLRFTKVNEQKKFTLTFRRSGGGGKNSSGYAEGQLKWVSHKNVVRSPISIKFDK